LFANKTKEWKRAANTIDPKRTVAVLGCYRLVDFKVKVSRVGYRFTIKIPADLNSHEAITSKSWAEFQS
jgi:hypothetical protein